jgi:hypothetical protein
MRAMRHLTALGATLLATAALAQAPTPAKPMTIDVTLVPKKVHEECAQMKAGETLRFHWKSDVPVDFNIHYHRGNDVFYPVKREAMRGDGGSFTSKSAEDYCWMWTARDLPARIEGGIQK